MNRVHLRVDHAEGVLLDDGVETSRKWVTVSRIGCVAETRLEPVEAVVLGKRHLEWSAVQCLRPRRPNIDRGWIVL